ncbi:hypothetical protein [Microcoleus sp. herbarium2]|uniref:hypothetical protein n=1 Tax=Microcoleus sp. herbarium2 TaxID=3055433 RepID=UPI002FD3E95B
MVAGTADNLQLPAWELEVESEPEPSGETSWVRSPINNQVNNSGSRKIPLALATSLGVLVFGTGAGAIALMRSGNETLKQAKILAVAEFADFAAGHHRKLVRQYNAASEFRRCQHLYN